MLLSPLESPKNPITRWFSTVKILPVLLILGTTLLLYNLSQCVTWVIIKPLSRKIFQRFIRFGGNAWWVFCTSTGKLIHGYRIVVTGDELPKNENALLLPNHQQMTDIIFLYSLAQTKGRMGDLKWFLKWSIRYVPGVGWGLIFLDNLFVKRRWSRDKDSIAKTFNNIIKHQIPAWIVLFAEGTRATESKVARMNAVAAKRKGRESFKYLLPPHTKGFEATLEGLGSHLGAVYNITIAYPNGVPTMWQMARGFANIAHIHVQRFEKKQIPQEHEQRVEWLKERFREKDRLLSGFCERGYFS